MRDETRVELVKKEIEMYLDQAKVIEKMIDVAEKFDMKPANIRFQSALNEVTNPLGFSVVIKNDVGTFEIVGYSTKLSKCYITEQNSRGQVGTFYITNRDFTIRATRSECVLTNQGRAPRLLSKGISEALNSYKHWILNRVQKMENDLLRTDEMLKDAEEIQSLMKRFDEKYNGRVREVMGCNFGLQFYDSAYRRYW